MPPGHGPPAPRRACRCLLLSRRVVSNAAESGASMQTWCRPGPAASRNSEYTLSPRDRRDQLELGVACVADIEMCATKSAGRPRKVQVSGREVDVRHPDPLLGAQQRGQRLFGGVEVPRHPRNLDRCLVMHRVEDIPGRCRWLERVLVWLLAEVRRQAPRGHLAGSHGIRTESDVRGAPLLAREPEEAATVLGARPLLPNDGSMASPVARWIARPSSIESQPMPTAPGPNCLQISSSSPVMWSTSNRARSLPSLLIVTSIQLTSPPYSQVAVNVFGGSQVCIVPWPYPPAGRAADGQIAGDRHQPARNALDVGDGVPQVFGIRVVGLADGDDCASPVSMVRAPTLRATALI